MSHWSQSMILGVLDPSGAAATWRAYYSHNRKNIITASSSSAEFRTTGEPISMNNRFNYKKNVSAGTRGTAFDQQDDDNYWQSKQMQPLILRPLGSGIRNAMLINEGESHTNPIAGTNDFSGGMVSRASGMNPMNYTLVDSNDISDRLRANTVSANDPLSAQYALSLSQGQKMDPNNIEGNAMLNTFQSEESAVRQSKTQLINSELFASQDVDSVDRDPTFQAGLNARAYFNRLKQNLPKNPLESLQKHTFDLAKAATTLKMRDTDLLLAQGIAIPGPADDEDDGGGDNNDPPPDGGGDGGASGGGGGGLNRYGDFVASIPEQSSSSTSSFERGTDMMSSAPLARQTGFLSSAGTVNQNSRSATANVGTLVNNQPGETPFTPDIYSILQKSNNQPDPFGAGGIARVRMEVGTAILLNQKAHINHAANKLERVQTLVPIKKKVISGSTEKVIAANTTTGRSDVGEPIRETPAERKKLVENRQKELLGFPVPNLWTKAADIMDMDKRDKDPYHIVLAAMIRNQADHWGYYNSEQQDAALQNFFQTMSREKVEAAMVMQEKAISYMSTEGTHEIALHEIADAFGDFMSQMENRRLPYPSPAYDDFNNMIRRDKFSGGAGGGGSGMDEGSRTEYVRTVDEPQKKYYNVNESSNVGRRPAKKEALDYDDDDLINRGDDNSNMQNAKQRNSIMKGSYAVQPTDLYSQELSDLKATSKATNEALGDLVKLLRETKERSEVHNIPSHNIINNIYGDTVVNHNNGTNEYYDYLDQSSNSLNDNRSFYDARSEQYNSQSNNFMLVAPPSDVYGQHMVPYMPGSGGGGGGAQGGGGGGGNKRVSTIDPNLQRIGRETSSIEDRKSKKQEALNEMRGIGRGGGPVSQNLLMNGNIEDYAAPVSNDSVTDTFSESVNQSAFAMSSSAVVEDISNQSDRLLSFLNSEGLVRLDPDDSMVQYYDSTTANRRNIARHNMRKGGEVYKEKSEFAKAAIRAVPTMEGLLRQNNEQAVMEILSQLVHACYDTKDGNKDAKASQKLFMDSLAVMGPIAHGAGLTPEQLVYIMTDIMAFISKQPTPNIVKPMRTKITKKKGEIDVSLKPY
jgi:hypothetical protein